MPATAVAEGLSTYCLRPEKAETPPNPLQKSVEVFFPFNVKMHCAGISVPSMNVLLALSNKKGHFANA
ncbi:hypothetical protein WM40_26660 [Robbsia andropogonis]|uniref:Uncharacterized protein n=1 Tax=Robbsia andropogonis TaxID=28092 RepID=A0A0F5JTA3_9BURK|nr:hypothetical protein WM40_26660 [Robbsia andropogonis]